MRFSIVMPVYNSERYLTDCLDSLLSQSFNDFEVVLIDDGSTDSSSLICDRYCADRANWQVIHQENKGPWLARRKGFECVSGDYVVPVDADDLLHTLALEALQEIVDEYQPDIVAFNFALDPSLKHGVRAPLSEGYYGDVDFERFRKAVCLGNPGSLIAKAIKSEVITGLPTFSGAPEKMRFYEDWLDLIAAIDRSTSAYYLDRNLYFHRTVPTSITHNFNPMNADQLAYVLVQLARFAGRWGEEYSSVVHQAIILSTFNTLQLIRLNEQSRSSRISIYEHARDSFAKLWPRFDQCTPRRPILTRMWYTDQTLRALREGHFLTVDGLLGLHASARYLVASIQRLSLATIRAAVSWLGVSAKRT